MIILSSDMFINELICILLSPYSYLWISFKYSLCVRLYQIPEGTDIKFYKSGLEGLMRLHWSTNNLSFFHFNSSHFISFHFISSLFVENYDNVYILHYDMKRLNKDLNNRRETLIPLFFIFFIYLNSMCRCGLNVFLSNFSFPVEF